VTINNTGSFSIEQLNDDFPRYTKWTFTGMNKLGLPEVGFVVLQGNYSFVAGEDGDGNPVPGQPLSGEGRMLDICELLS
jgi:hypothetical protein